MCHYYSDQVYYHIANNSSQNLTAGYKILNAGQFPILQMNLERSCMKYKYLILTF